MRSMTKLQEMSNRNDSTQTLLVKDPCPSVFILIRYSIAHMLIETAHDLSYYCEGTTDSTKRI
jgi:hypothetical protein